MDLVARSVWLCAAAIFVAVGLGCAPLQRNESNIVSVNLSKNWERADRSNRKGIQHLCDRQPHLAEAQFRKAIQINEGHGGAHNNLGLIYYRRRDLYPAATQFQKAMEYMPHKASPVNNLAMALEAAGRVDEAIELYRKANEMEPTNALFLGNLVRAKIRSGCQDDLVVQQLKDLLLYDKRSDWVDWSKEQLEIFLNPYLDRGPSTPESPLSPQTSESSDPLHRRVIETPVDEPAPQRSPKYWDGSLEPAARHAQPLINDPMILDSQPQGDYGGNSVLQLSSPSEIYEDVPVPVEPSMIRRQSAEMPMNDHLKDLVELQVEHIQ